MSTEPDTPADTEGAAAPPRRKRQAALLLLASPVAGFALLYVVAGVYLRHVPYAIPPALQAPAASPAGEGLRLRYLGVSGYSVSDGETTIWIDPTPTRPSLTELISGPLAPNPALYDDLGLTHADYILVNHAHYDHVLDVPQLALRTGATVVGSRSTINLCRSRGVPVGQLVQVDGGERLALGTFDVRVRAFEHGPIGPFTDPMPGVIPADAGPLWYWQYRQDGVRHFRLEAAGTSLLFHPGRPYPEHDPTWTADTVLMMVAKRAFSDAAVDDLLERLQPRRILPTHYDNFFHPLSAGLALMPGFEPEAFARRLQARRPELAVHLLDFGQTLTLPPDE